MRTVTFKSVRDSAARLLGLDPDKDLNSTRFSALTEYINLRVAEAYSFCWWPEWTLIEQRQYRASWSATTYTAGTATVPVEVFYVPAQAYYQCIKNAGGTNLPATLVSGEYVVNAAYWAECAGSYDGDDWAALTAYVAGDQVRNPSDNRFYQCHTAETSGATWSATNWGILTDFEKSIAWEQTGQAAIGQVRAAYARNPKAFPATPWEYQFAPNDDGILLETAAPAVVWLEFRKPAPEFTGTAWSGTKATYALNELVYLSSSGQCYKALVAGASNTNKNPASETTYWEVVSFPAAIAGFVKRAACADCLRDSKQTSRAQMEENRAYTELYEASDRMLSQMGQYEVATVVHNW